MPKGLAAIPRQVVVVAARPIQAVAVDDPAGRVILGFSARTGVAGNIACRADRVVASRVATDVVYAETRCALSCARTWGALGQLADPTRARAHRAVGAPIGRVARPSDLRGVCTTTADADMAALRVRGTALAVVPLASTAVARERSPVALIAGLRVVYGIRSAEAWFAGALVVRELADAAGRRPAAPNRARSIEALAHSARTIGGRRAGIAVERARFGLATEAAVADHCVAVVALLVRPHEPVAADVPFALQGTRGVVGVVRTVVAVLDAAPDEPVAADGMPARRRTLVIVVVVAVVALFVRVLEKAVAAGGELALVGAAVGIVGVAVVTLLVLPARDAVAALVRAAVAQTSVFVDEVAVVACLVVDGERIGDVLP